MREACLYNNWSFVPIFLKIYREHSLCNSGRSTHLLHLYFLFSWWRHQMETCSASLAFVRGIHRWLRGIHRSSVNSPHTDQWRGALMFSLNKRLSKQSRRRLFQTPSRSLWRHCIVVPNSDPVIRAAVRAFGVQRVTLELVKRVKLGGSVHYVSNGLKFGTLLYPD